MYRCEITKRNSRENDKLNKVVAVWRNKTYYRWVKSEETKQYEEVECGSGKEAVRELSLSKEGLEIWAGWNADQRAMWLKTN